MSNINDVSHKLMIFVGIFMYVCGSIGNILNIYVFTIWSRKHKKSHKSCHSRHRSNGPIYLLVSAISNLIVIVYPLFTRILIDGYQYPIDESNVWFLCKLRYFILHTFDLTSLTCICLATFDRYLITSRNVRLRQLSSTRRRTKCIILFVICLFGLHSIPIFIYYNASEGQYCEIISKTYLYYYLCVFQIFLHSLIPIIFLSIFGILTFRQLRSIHKRKSRHGNFTSDKQLSHMLLLISLAIILSSIPYAIEQSYYVLFDNKPKNRYQFSAVFLYHVTCSLLFYTNPVASFYIYYISTRKFRSQISNLLCCRDNVHYIVTYRIKSVTMSTQSLRESNI